jgi:hypothetical protein
MMEGRQVSRRTESDWNDNRLGSVICAGHRERGIATPGASDGTRRLMPEESRRLI